ncbi:BRO-N domain-containing protein [Laribacter hongkongensis]|uniref:BRO-N domain-containing protein n=1 Tax=Laribacter hongkongensis TaxID=168471 RepID=UPI001EFE00F1|nr:Bro-N domain-containing protein [Laribacter hongkongensis]MCG9076341.1 Bro-N domain-containing protein [Laribacter hongkongensis]
MSTELIPFDFEGRPVRVVTDAQGEPWFVAADVAQSLEYRMASDMTRSLDDDEKGTQIVRTPSGNQEMLVINESGLYSAILKSRKPEAKRFKRWVTHEVLPAIRKTGAYAAGATLPALPVPTQDRVSSILLIGEAVAKVPGVKAGIAMAATLTCIQENTGLAVETLRRALPAANAPICSLNATQLGKLINRSAKATNQLLAATGLQFRNERDEWELTEAGEAWAEAMPYSRNGHSGYQILWNPAVVEQLKEVA